MSAEAGEQDVQVNPEKAAKHAAAAARKALEAAQHAHKAAMYAGLQQQNAYEVQTWHTNSKCEPSCLCCATTAAVAAMAVPRLTVYSASLSSLATLCQEALLLECRNRSVCEADLTAF